MRIIDLHESDAARILAVAEIMTVSFRGISSSYQTLEDALESVSESFEDHELSRIAIDSDGNVVGRIAGISQYDGNVWELDPLVVRRDSQLKGIGRALVADFENCVGEKGGRTIWLGTDDENGRTSLSQGDLFPGVLDKAKELKNLNNHPFAFYQKLGFEVVGVLPDANGPGKPDIFMAKPVRSLP